MGARLGVREDGNSPHEGLSMDEHYAAIQTGVYPPQPLINQEDWQLLKRYIIDQAPDSLAATLRQPAYETVRRFKATTMALDSVGGTIQLYEAESR